MESGPEEEEQEADAVEMVEEPERSEEPKLMLWSSSARSSGILCTDEERDRERKREF